MIDIISSAPLFKGLHPEVISGIVENANERQFATGQLIVQEGDSLKELYIIIEGEVSIEKNSGDELYTRGVGESLGEMTLIDLGTRSVSVRAKSDVNIAVVDLVYLTTLFDNNPKILTTIAINIARILSIRLRESDEDSKS